MRMERQIKEIKIETQIQATNPISDETKKVRDGTDEPWKRESYLPQNTTRSEIGSNELTSSWKLKIVQY